MVDDWIREGECYVVVYSITNLSSLKTAGTIIEKRGANEAAPLIMLVGNKCDLTDEREVQNEMGTDMADQHGCCDFLETSAKSQINVKETFENLVKTAWRK